MIAGLDRVPGFMGDDAEHGCEQEPDKRDDEHEEGPVDERRHFWILSTAFRPGGRTHRKALSAVYRSTRAGLATMFDRRAARS